MIAKLMPAPCSPPAVLLAVAALCFTAGAAMADIEVRFDEGAPKDRFTLRNAGECAIENAEIVIDLSGSAGALVFDVTAEGAGVEVFQPFEVVEGADALSAMPEVRDGDTAVALAVQRLAPGGAIAFTIDVDDTVNAREITVTDGEIEGAGVRITAGETTGGGSFDGSDMAIMPLDACVG